MQRHARKNQISAIGIRPSQRKGRSKATLRFVDGRPEANQNGRLQEMANDNPQAKKAAQLQAMINDSSYMKAVSDRTDRRSGIAAQRQEAPEDEELQLKVRSGPVQRQDEPEEEEPLQGEFTTKVAPARKTSSSSAIQRMVGINSADVHSEVRGLIADPTNIPKMTEAYTYLQHIDWAHNIVGGRVFDMGSPAFQRLSGSENLILVAHGLEGVSGRYNGAQIADHLAASGTGVPDGWRGGVYITSCYSGAGVDSVVKDVATRLQALGKTGISVTGYTGTTITHKQFQEFLFVVNPAKETEMKAISDRVALKYKALFGEWHLRMQGLTADNILEMAAYTSELTATAYAEIVTEASEKGYFMGPEDAEVTHTS